jgi:hypothetical protein
MNWYQCPDMALRSDNEVPRLKHDEVEVKQGKTFLQVTQLIPALGDNAALQLLDHPELPMKREGNTTR